MQQQLSLIPEKLASPKQRKVPLDELPMDLIGAEPEQSFIESIKKFGILQPIGLMENGDGYQVAFGRRRIKAARALEMLSIPALIYPQGWTPISTLTLIENKQRSDNIAAALDAIAQLRLIASSEEICAATGITQQELSKAIKLIDGLTPELQSAVKEGRMTSSTAQKAIKLPVNQQQLLSQQEAIKPKDVAQYLQVQKSEAQKPVTDALFSEPSKIENSHSILQFLG
jgi:ParB/RepB/Spo0J family partition protein